MDIAGECNPLIMYGLLYFIEYKNDMHACIATLQKLYRLFGF